MPGCAHCGGSLDIVANQVGRGEPCPHCGEPLHSCRNCRHFEETAPKQCKEPFAEVPTEKDLPNFCDLFQLGEGRVRDTQARERALSAAEALFRKK